MAKKEAKKEPLNLEEFFADPRVKAKITRDVKKARMLGYVECLIDEGRYSINDIASMIGKTPKQVDGFVELIAQFKDHIRK